MDGRPFRVPPSADNRTPNRPPQRQAEEPRPVVEEPKAAPHRAAPQTTKEEKSAKRSRRSKLPLIIIIIVVVLGALAWVAGSTFMQNTGTAIDKDKYQAVFFTNGQVYFGKLDSFNRDYMKLTDIYYLQTKAGEESDSDNPQQTSNNQSNVQLIKLGDEVHGPEDLMIISKEQMLFYENLKDDSKVSTSIEQYKKDNK